MNVRWRILPLGLLFTLAGCKDINFGDHIYDWVEANAARLSKEHAEADLPDRWLAAQEATVLGLSARLLALRDRLARIQLPTIENASETALLGIRQSMIELDLIESEAEQTAAELKLWEGICDSRQIFELAGMNRISTAPPIEPHMEENFEFYIGTDFEKMFDHDILGNSLAYEISKQNSRAHSAIGRYQELALQGDALFNLSKNKCHEESQATSDLQASLRETLQQIFATARALGSALSLQRDQVERKLVPEEIQSLLKDLGIAEELAETARGRINDDLKIRVRAARITLQDLAQKIGGTPDCEGRIQAAEDYEDALVALIAQIDTALEAPTGLEPDLLSTLRDYRSQADKDLTRLRVSLSQLAKRGCR